MSRLNADLVREKPTPENRRPCQSPVMIPNRDLTEGETERLWYEDRVRLVICARRKLAVDSFYETRDAKIAGSK